jgi:hypothetical protein
MAVGIVFYTCAANTTERKAILIEDYAMNLARRTQAAYVQEAFPIYLPYAHRHETCLS